MEFIKKYGLLILGIGAVIGVGVWYWKKKADEAKKEKERPLDYAKLLKLGDEGKEVAFVQNYLNNRGVAPKLTVNGKFDAQTEKNLQSYMSKKETTIRMLISFVKNATPTPKDKSVATNDGEGGTGQPMNGGTKKGYFDSNTGTFLPMGDNDSGSGSNNTNTGGTRIK